MTIKLTLKQMKELKRNACYIINENKNKDIDIHILGNNYYYANNLGCRIRVQEGFTIKSGCIVSVIIVNQDYEGIFR